MATPRSVGFTVALPYTKACIQGLCHALNPGSGQPTLAPSRMRRNDSRADAKQLSYEQHRAANLVVQEHEKDPKLSRYPPYNSCCARMLLATLHSAACLRSATLRLNKPQNLSSISSTMRLLHRWLAQRHEIGGGSGETVPLAKQGPICLRRTQHLLAHQSHISWVGEPVIVLTWGSPCANAVGAGVGAGKSTGQCTVVIRAQSTARELQTT